MLKGIINAGYGEKNTTGLTEDKELSGKRVKVFHDNVGDTHVVHRGTSGIHDVMTDAFISLGGDIKKTNRYKHADKITKQARAKYGAANTTVVGHSLGGKLAEMTGRSSDKGIITVNKAAVVTDIGKKRKKNQTDIRHTNDVVSALSTTQRGGKVVTLKNKTKNALTAHAVNNIRF